jgi:hypothetical protein
MHLANCFCEKACAASISACVGLCEFAPAITIAIPIKMTPATRSIGTRRRERARKSSDRKSAIMRRALRLW